MSTIAIIDDDVYIGNMLEKLLTEEGYQIMRAYSGTEALMMLERCRPDIVLLDLMMPGLTGDQVLKQIHGIPVIIMSAKIDVDSKVNTLLDGATDYITKPFDVRELLARITVHLRNAKAGVAPSKESFSGSDTTHEIPNNKCVFDTLSLDMDTHELTSINGTIRLTNTEYAIAKLLMQNSGQVITKTQVLDKISYDTPDCTESSLKVHVSNLRKKLNEISGKDYIESVWGIGFRLNANKS